MGDATIEPMPATQPQPPANADTPSPALRPRIRVLFVIGALGGGGAERQLLHILKGLNRSRFEPLLYLFDPVGELLDQLPADVRLRSFRGEVHYGFFIRLIGWLKGSRLLRWWKLHRVIREEQPDLVWDRLYLTTLDTSVPTWWRRTPRVSSIAADPEVQLRMYARRFIGWQKSFARWAYRTADVVLANSEGLRQRVIAFFALPPDQVHMIPNIVDLDAIDRLAAEPCPWEAPTDQVPCPQLVTIGRVDRDKGHQLLVEAVAQIVARSPATGLHLHILGQGPELESLRQLIHDLGLAQRVTLHGFVANPYPYLKHADLFCLASLTEGLPNVLLEALACGTPIVSTDCPSGPREILDGGRLGELVPVNDIPALAAAIERSLSGSLVTGNDRAERAAAGRAWVEARYSRAAGLAAVEQLIESVLNYRNG